LLDSLLQEKAGVVVLEMANSLKELTVVHVLLFISFLLSGLFINGIQLLLFLVVVRGAGNRRLFRSINYYLVYAIYAQLLFLADWWSGSTVSYYCDKETLESLGQEHAVILMNHHYELDWLLGWMVGDRASVLGNCRVYVKKNAQVRTNPWMGLGSFGHNLPGKELGKGPGHLEERVGKDPGLP
jgi:hypothetical protein